MADSTADTRRTTSGESTPGLVSDALSHVTRLVQGEINLVRAEVQEQINKAATAVGMLVAAVVLLLTALNVLAAALTAWLTETGMDAGWAALIVGGALAVIGTILALKGKSDLRLVSLAPTRSVKNVQRDAEAVREGATHGR